MRKLASIRQVGSIIPIDGADNIVLAKVDGWQCVVKKDEFQPGDLGVYFEIDSIVPDEPTFEFMRKSNFRVRTIKLRGQLSQGLMLPLAAFPSVQLPTEVGSDVTDLLKVGKYEPPVDYSAIQAAGSFPYFLRKTDQERIQNCFKEIDWYDSFEVTEKLEGTSITFYHYDGRFGACSRNLEMSLVEGSKYHRLNEKYNLEAALSKYGGGIAIQGECIGPGIQGNYYGLKDIEYHIFSVYNINTQRYLDPLAARGVLDVLGLSGLYVPIIAELFHNSSKSPEEVLQLLLNWAEEEKSLINPSKNREGLVFKGYNNQSFKVISNKYLLKG